MTIQIVDGAWLEGHLVDPGVRVVEVSSRKDPASREARIPGAVRWYWKDLCWHDTDRQLATPAEMAERLGRAGVSRDATLVLYGDPVQYGTYAAWVLSMAGHPDIRVLDGAYTRWARDGRPLSAQEPEARSVEYGPAAAGPSARVGRDDVLQSLGRAGRLLLDVRSPEEYRGERVMPPPGFDHGAERTGRIPGAVHLFYRDLLNDDDTFRAPNEIRAALETVGAGPDQSADVIAYCRLSHRATLVWAAMTVLLGWDNARIYDGSWTEWGSIVGFPVEK